MVSYGLYVEMQAELSEIVRILAPRRPKNAQTLATGTLNAFIAYNPLMFYAKACYCYLLGSIKDKKALLYLDKLVFRPFLPIEEYCDWADFFDCCVRRIIHRSNCSNSTSFMMCRSRKSGLSIRNDVTCSGISSVREIKDKEQNY